MIKLIVKNVNKYVCTVFCGDKIYKINIELINFELYEKDIIYLSKEMFDKCLNEFTTFEETNNVSKEMIIVERNKNRYYFERLYG